MYVDFNILNQLGSPSINSNTYANRPSAGQTGRLFVSTDTFEIYRDNGTTWDLIGGPGSSTITGTGTATQVAYFTSAQAIGSSANLFFDATNNRLGVGTSAPAFTIEANGDILAEAIYLDGATSGNGALYWTSDRVTLANYNASGIVRIETAGGAAAATFGADLTATIVSGIGTKGYTGSTSYAALFNGSVGVNTATPGAALDVHSTGTIAQFNTTSGSGNTYISWQRAGAGLWRLGDTYNGGNNFFELHNTTLAIDALEFEAATNKSTFQATQTYTTGLARANYLDYNLSVAAGGSFSSPNAITALGASLDLSLAGNATIPSGARSGLDAYNSVSFTGTGTLTHTQGTQIRAYSNLTTGWAFSGSATGTITHLAGMRVLFPDNTGSAVSVTNNYALLINDQTANTGTVTYTNRFGIYQEGASDTNYFAATTLVGTNVNSGYKFEVSGSANATTLFQNGVQVLTTASISGTTNFISKFTSASAIGNSQIFDNGTSVGIGTSTPTTILNVHNSTGPSVITNQTYNGIISIWNASDSSIVYFGSTSNHPLAFITSNTERMRIFSDGNVGINTGSTNAGFKLDVNGTGRFSGNLAVSGNLSVNNSSGTAVSLNGTSFVGIEYSRNSNIYGFVGTENSASGGMRYNSVNGNYEHNFYTNSVLSFQLASTGAATFSSSVTATLMSSSEFYNATGYPYNTTFGSGANASTATLRAGSTSGFQTSIVLQGGDVGNTIILSTASSERMRITSGGNVLVGTTINSGYLLDVNGTLRSGTLTINTNGQGRVFSTYYGSGSDGANIFIGDGGLLSETGGGSSFLGSYNSAMGVNALYFNTTGFYNSAMGAAALYHNTSGFFNSAMGTDALLYNTTGYQNAAIGANAGYFTNAGSANETSNNSVYLGYDTRSSASGNTNEIVIGSGGRGEGSNSIRLGNTSITAVKTSGSITTGAPSGGTAAAWKFGERVASAGVTLNDSQYIQLDVGGTTYYLATVNTS